MTWVIKPLMSVQYLDGYMFFSHYIQAFEHLSSKITVSNMSLCKLIGCLKKARETL